MLTDELIRKIVADYLSKKPVDYIRLRWFYRRLAQIGHPGGIDVTLDLIDDLAPCFASICTYLASVQSIAQEKWLEIGLRLLTLLDREEVGENKYFRLSIMNLFSRNANINHFGRLAAKFEGSDPFAKREIILAADMSGSADWLRELKENFAGMDYWQKIAFLYACRKWPSDERKFFINRLALERPFEAELAAWAKS